MPQPHLYSAVYSSAVAAVYFVLVSQAERSERLFMPCVNGDMSPMGASVTVLLFSSTDLEVTPLDQL